MALKGGFRENPQVDVGWKAVRMHLSSHWVMDRGAVETRDWPLFVIISIRASPRVRLSHPQHASMVLACACKQLRAAAPPSLHNQVWQSAKVPVDDIMKSEHRVPRGLFPVLSSQPPLDWAVDLEGLRSQPLFLDLLCLSPGRLSDSTPALTPLGHGNTGRTEHGCNYCPAELDSRTRRN